MNVIRITPAAPTAAYAALNANTARRNEQRFPVGTLVMDFSTGARGEVVGHVAATPMHTVRLNNGVTVTRYPSTLEPLSSDRPRGNGRLVGGVEVWA